MVLTGILWDGPIQPKPGRTTSEPTVVGSNLFGHAIPWPLPFTGEVSIHLLTDTTIRGVTSSLEWEATVTFDGNGVVELAQTSFPFSIFRLSRPRLAFILSVEDSIRLELDLVAKIIAGE